MSAISVPLSHGAALDALLDVGADHDHAVDVDAGQVHGVGVEVARLDELLDLCDAHAPGHRGQRREVARRLVEHEVAEAVALQGVHEREVGGDRLLEHELVRLAGELEGLHGLGAARDRDRPVGVVPTRQAAIRDLRADARLREERRDAAAARAELLGEGSLRRELELELAREVLPLELLVLADVRRGHLGDALLREQHAEPPVVDAAVVRDDRESVDARVEQGLDQHHRDAAEPEPADGETGS